MKLICIMLLAVSSYSFAAQQGKSDKVRLTINPESPTVFDTDYNINGRMTIHAPWIESFAVVSNNSDQMLTVAEIQYTISDPVNHTTSTVTVSPSFYNFAMSCNQSVTQDISFDNFGEFAPGESDQLKLDYRGTVNPGCRQPPSLHPTLYTERLGMLGVHGFNIEMRMTGWFGANTPTSTRFEKVLNFITN